MQARLVTIGISHFCEKARWALEWTGVPYREEAHGPGLHMLATRPLGGRSTPVLVWEGRVLRDSTDILRALSASAPAERRLYPEDDAGRAEVDALEDTFDTKLGPAIRRAMYFLLLQYREQALSALTRNLPSAERAVLSAGFPLFRALIQRSLRIDEAGAARSREVVDRVFSDVAARLADGRPYLFGDRFGAADLTFASLAAPGVLAPGYGGGGVPSLAEVPEDVRALVSKWRDTPAGAFALRMYEQHRTVR